MKETPKRDHLVGARFREDDRDVVKLAARRRGVTISELVRSAVMASATQILTPKSGPGARP